MKRRVFALVLAVIMALGLAAPALAYTTPDFSDLPVDNWAYAPVMRMADQGIIQGTGNGEFSPELKVSVAQFLTLVGRIVFPETTVGANDTWYGPYVAAARANGLLTGTQVNPAAPEAEITRYDMAVILRAAAKKLGKTETLAQQSQVTDYGVIPNMYTEAVLAVYGMGLIKGDQSGSFNGSNTMQRNELATVIDRLVALKTPGGITDPEKPEETEKPEDPEPPVETKGMKLTGWMRYGAKGHPEERNSGTGVENVPFQLRYTEDYGTTYTVIAEGTTGRGNWYGDDTPGYFELTAQVEKSTFDKFWDGVGQLYISAETMVNGQRYVTQDRRTDGKASVIPIGHDWTRFFVELVSPNGGEMMDIPVAGIVTAKTYVGPADRTGEIRYYGSGEGHQRLLTNSTVRIYFDPQQEGVSRVLIAETTADGGFIKGTVSIDSAYYRTKGAYYVVEIEAFLDGQLCTNTSYNAREPITLSQLKGEHKQFWNAESDEYWEIGLGTTRP